MLETLDYASFLAARESLFRLQGGETALEVRLEQVERHPNSESRPGHECFSLFFRLPGGVRLGQGVHRLEHEGLGALDLFLVPVSPDVCEAVINRLAPPGG